MEKTRIAVVGSGYWGKNLIRNFNALGLLAAICDEDESKLQALRLEYPTAKIFNSSARLFSSKQVDAVAIATPAETHHPLCREALRKGKDVFVEKPLGLSVKEAAELNRLADRHGRVLMVGHLLRYHPAVIKLTEMVSSGEIGKLQYIYSNRLNLGKIRQEENILWSFAPHDISVILALTGQMPAEVSCFGGQYLQEKIADVTLSTMLFPGGVRAHVFVSWLHPYKEQKFIVVGTEKMAVFDDVEKEEKLILYPHKITWKGLVPVPDRKEAEVVRIDRTEPLRNECTHFIECIRRRSRPRTDGEEGQRVLRVLTACQSSLEAHGKTMEMNSMATEEGTYFVHPSAVIDEPVAIGSGTRIWHFSHVLKESTIGRNCRIGQNVVIGPRVSIGHNAKIQNNVSVYEGVTLEDDVFCGPSVVFTNVNNPRCEIPRMHQLKKTMVQRGATIGANATVVCGNTIGRYAFIGAGAVVTKEVPDYGFVMGNPARQDGWVCRCAARLEGRTGELHCPSCGNAYFAGRKRLRVVREEQ